MTNTATRDVARQGHLGRHLAPTVVGLLATLLVWAVAADVIRSAAVFLILIATFPAFLLALLAAQNVHNPNEVVWALASGVQWAWIATLFFERGRPAYEQIAPTGTINPDEAVQQADAADKRRL
jgi:hypothetical protein